MLETILLMSSLEGIRDAVAVSMVLERDSMRELLEQYCSTEWKS